MKRFALPVKSSNRSVADMITNLRGFPFYRRKKNSFKRINKRYTPIKWGFKILNTGIITFFFKIEKVKNVGNIVIFEIKNELTSESYEIIHLI